MRLEQRKQATLWGLRTTMIGQVKNFAILAGIFALTACSLPRGAAMEVEIVSDSQSADAGFSVEEVTRANVGRLDDWPETGWHGHYHWPEATRGPKSSVIQVGDMINLTIWDSQANSLLTNDAEKNVGMSSIQVSASGTVFVPYVDEVVVRGLTPQQARERIQFELEPIAPSAQVQLALVQGQDNSVDLVSGVANPGSYPLPDRNYTILSLIAKGGGINPAMRNPVVRLMRQGHTYEIPRDDLFSKASKNIALRGNDKIIVEREDRHFIALGATGKESLIYFPSEEVNALEALSLVGGIQDSRADPQGVLVLREYEADDVRTDGSGPSTRQVVFSLDLTSAGGLFAARNFQIHPDDVVLATESPVKALQTIMGLFGSFAKFSVDVNKI